MRWTIIKSVLHNQVIKISYLVVIGLPIVLELLQVFNFTPKISNSIYDIFYSGILLLVAILIYNVFGPTEITHYEDIHDYVNKNIDSAIKAYPDKKKNIVVAHLDGAQSASKSKILELDKAINEELSPGGKKKLQSQLDEFLEPLYPGCIDRYLQKQWNIADQKKNFPALILCFIIVAAAIILAIAVFCLRIKIVIDYNHLI